MKVLNRFTALLAAFLIVLQITSCGGEHQSGSNSMLEDAPRRSQPLSEQELKDQLEDKECRKPSTYLSGTLSYEPKYKNALSLKVKGLKIECRIRNEASLATFKDINAKVEFKSRTGAVVVRKNFTVYEFIKPGRSYTYKTEFSVSNQQYKDISSMSWTIVNASCN